MSEPPWSLVVAPSADRILARLPEKAAAAVAEFMLGPLLDDPYRVGHRPRRELKGFWAAHRGPYRVVHEIDDEAREIHVLRLDHRADVYRAR